MAANRQRHRTLFVATIALGLFIASGPLRFLWVSGAPLGSRSIQVDSSTINATTTYSLSFDGQSAGTVGSVRFQFCSNDPLIGTPCTPPTGFDLTSAVLVTQTGMTGFSIDTTNSTANIMVLTRTAGPSIPTPSTYTFNTIKNPNGVGSYYVRIETFTSNDASGSHSDYGGLAFDMVSPLTVSAYVPPYLLFCTGIKITSYDCATAQGDYIDFGDINSTKTGIGQTQILAATNAANGYNIRVAGSTLTSGNNVIPQLIQPDVSRQGVSQFGLNLRTNGTPHTGTDPQGPGTDTIASAYNTPDFFQFNSNDIVATTPAVDDYRLYTASYIVNVSKSQPSGVYVATISYIALANF